MRDYVICIDASVDIEQRWIDENNVIIAVCSQVGKSESVTVTE